MRTRPVFALFLAASLNAMLAQLAGNPLAGLEQLKDFETMRASSSDPDWRNGNADARPIPPGGTLTVAELKGPGVITHIWNTIAHDAPGYSRLMTLRIYWDGEEHPSVEAPIGDFFGIGHGLDKSFVSLPIKVSSDGRGRNCYWPMPFRKAAKLTVSNESERPCGAFYFYVDWQKHKSLPKGTAYFHAMYRQEFPCVMGRNYLLADIAGNLRGNFIHSWDYGTYRVTLDGRELATADLWAEQPVRKASNWGRHKLAAGAHLLRLECTGKSAKSKGYFLGLDSLDLVTRVYERPPGFDLRKAAAPK